MEALVVAVIAAFLNPIAEKIMLPILNRYSGSDMATAGKFLFQIALASALALLAVVYLISLASAPTLTGAESVAASLWTVLLFIFLGLARRRWRQLRQFHALRR